MIYTVTLNPAIDYIVSVPQFKTGVVNRTTKELIYPGGKGINVSLVLKNLDIDNTALGYIAGFTGEELNNILLDKGIQTDFVRVKEGFTRINVKLRAEVESEINGQGPKLNSQEMEELYNRLSRLNQNDYLVLAGSIPDTMPSTIYMSIMERLQDKNIKVVVDATKDLLINVLKYKPFLIKPNHHELGEIFGVKLRKKEEVLQYANQLREMGAQNVLVSMAADGAVLVTSENEMYYSEAPKGVLVNSVGAGDSMVAGFLAGYTKSGSYKEAFKMGVCAGSASAFSEELATKEQINQMYQSQVFLF